MPVDPSKDYLRDDARYKGLLKKDEPRRLS